MWLTPLEDTNHVAGVFLFGAAAAAKGLGAQDLVLARCLGPVEGRLVVVIGGGAPAASAGGRSRDDVEPARQTQAAALLRLHGLLQCRAPGHALVPVIRLGRVDGHVDLIHAGAGLDAQLGDAGDADLGGVLGGLVYILEYDEVAVLRERRLDEDGVVGNDRVVVLGDGGRCPASRESRHCGGCRLWVLG